MIMGYLTSGNIIVDAMGSINITGNIIPAVWYRTITKENGKPYLLAIVILAGIREKMEYNEIPGPFKGMPIVLLTAGLMAIAFCGFSGLL